MKKVVKLLLYITLIPVVLSLIYLRTILEFFQGLKNGEGLLLPVYNRIMYYFKHADNFNIICLLLFGCLSVIVLIGIDILVGKLLKKISKKSPTLLKTINSGWFLMTGQKLISICCLGLIFLVTCNLIIITYGVKHSTESPKELSGSNPVLVLGTSKNLRSGNGENLYYTYRIQSAVDLWNNGKVSYFIASGDRTGDDYDETRDIRNDLINAGVPEAKIVVDTAGYRTLDSMLRIREMYKTKELVIVSQSFHLHRALFLGMFYGIKVVGFSAKGSSTTGMTIREFLSKPKVVMDLILFNMQPKVLVSNSTIKYREDIRATSDLAIVLMITIGIALVSTIGVFFKYID